MPALQSKILTDQAVAVAPDEEHGNAFVGQFPDFTRKRSIQLGNFVIADVIIVQMLKI